MDESNAFKINVYLILDALLKNFLVGGYKTMKICHL